MSAQPRYGVDAPGVVRGLLGSGAVGLGLGAAFIAFGKPPWTDAVGALLAAAALVPTGLGLSMVAYAAGGKQVLRDALLNRLEWRGDEIVLDVGAGRGLMAVGAAKRVPRGRVLALDIWSQVDLSGNGPEALSTNARLERVADRIEILTGDARKLDLPDASVDVVVTPRSRTSFTASSLNSRLTFRRCISILQFQKHLILVSKEPAAVQTARRDPCRDPRSFGTGDQDVAGQTILLKEAGATRVHTSGLQTRHPVKTTITQR